MWITCEVNYSKRNAIGLNVCRFVLLPSFTKMLACSNQYCLRVQFSLSVCFLHLQSTFQSLDASLAGTLQLPGLRVPDLMKLADNENLKGLMVREEQMVLSLV